MHAVASGGEAIVAEKRGRRREEVQRRGMSTRSDILPQRQLKLKLWFECAAAGWRS